MGNPQTDRPSKQPWTRRRFLGASAAGLALASTSARGERSTPNRKLVAAVLEHADRWTGKSTGLGTLLSRAEFEVSPLDLDQSAITQPSGPDLIAFGSFTNNGPQYRGWVGRHAASLRDFVEAGGVVLEMTQSDQMGNRVTYLPEGTHAQRGDPDFAEVLPIDRSHPLVQALFPAGVDRRGEADFGVNNINWETFESWANLRVLLASHATGRRPCLLEGELGRGRFLLSSLHLDKCFDASGKAKRPPEVVALSQTFFDAVASYVRDVREGKAPAVAPTPMPADPTGGIMIGHVDETSARIWFRPQDSHLAQRDWICHVTADGFDERSPAQTDADHDFTALFDITGLDPDTPYSAQVVPDGGQAAVTATFRTAPRADQPAKVVLGLGSCAPSEPDPVWDRILTEGCEGFVFLGDTPYVDTGDLVKARERHRRFLVQPEIARMISKIPCWGTWDDHDFGLNDGHGDFAGKHVCRIAFTEYRANATFGQNANGDLQRDRFGDARGIHTSFRRGPLEVFLLDPRWFSRTEPSWADPSKTTCLGQKQWEWLRRSLTESTATFKALATGMIWDDKKNSESDDWHTYRHERDAIFDFIRDQKITGCFLIGGDIHVSRALRYDDRVGYDLWQFIVSPLHGGTIPSLNVPHPNLVHDAVEPHVFLRLEADTTRDEPRLHARWINRDGREIFAVELSPSDLGLG